MIPNQVQLNYEGSTIDSVRPTTSPAMHPTDLKSAYRSMDVLDENKRNQADLINAELKSAVIKADQPHFYNFAKVKPVKTPKYYRSK